ncbi:MAG: CDP-2,3-bis-(O-geranylgeranyl)-sn-glycerol synthase [Methanobacteriota archaeon]|nr:MAG: CDP-2,3-bis-(O-geranylgeranyl)-sn-glycerol synthase [Euryarchaeota archaeon]
MAYGFNEVAAAVVFFLPAYVANTAAGLFGGGRPVDLGVRLWDGRRLFGDGKTYRGLFAGVACGLLYRLLENIYLSRHPLSSFHLAFLLSFGALAGDMAGSFIKRRIGIAKGESAPFLDQLDFVIGGLLLASFAVELTMETVIILLLISPVGHLAVNIIGFLLHKKEVPW